MEMDADNAELNLEAIYDIPVNVSVVLGRTVMPISQLLKLGRGSVIELERNVGEAIDVHVNDRLVAKGEIIIVENRIGVTLTEIVHSEKD
jgi:flagellar motor switch protein FliN/FliY